MKEMVDEAVGVVLLGALWLGIVLSLTAAFTSWGI